jgi:hypothetical protein
MQMTELGFAALLMFLFISGVALFSGGMASNYSGFSKIVPETANFNSTYFNLSAALNTSQVQAQDTSTSQSGIDLLLGYFGGAFKAINTLSSLVSIFPDMLGLILLNFGVFLPSFVIGIISTAIILIIVIGVLFYLTKVR